MTVVLHEGGPEGGKVLHVAADLGDSDLWYETPGRRGLYRRSPRTVTMDGGETAEVWVFMGESPNDAPPDRRPG